MTSTTSVCVLCGSRLGHNPAYRRAAESLGRGIAERGMHLVYGGGSVGLMGVTAAAARGHGGVVIGIMPSFLLREEVGDKGLDTLIVTDSMHDRKRLMFERADAFVVLPGGIGTLDETFEILSWKALRLHNSPVVIFDVEGYWQPLEPIFNQITNAGFAHESVIAHYTLAKTLDEVFISINLPKKEIFLNLRDRR